MFSAEGAMDKMTDNIIVAIIAFAGTLVGTFGGIVASSRLTNYRLQQLEKKVDKHNSIVKRTYILEEKMKVVNHRVANLEKKTGE